MARQFKFQDPGEGIHEAEVVKILVSEGDEVTEGQDVLVVETDKANFDVSAPFGGTVQEIHVSEGDVIEVGDPILSLGEAGESTSDEDDGEASDEDGARKAKRPGEEPEREEKRKAEEQEREEKRGAKEKKRKEKRDAKEKEREEKRDAKEEKRDAKEKEREEKRDAKEKEREAAKTERGASDEGPVPASPATRRIARELGVDLAEVEPSGEGGRVLADDVRAFAERSAEGGAEPARRREGASELPDFSRFGEIERRPLRSVRRTIARRTQRAWSEIPHVTHQDVADVTELEGFRRRHATEVERRGGKLTLTVLMMKAVAAALSEHPRFNASLDREAEELVLKRYVHLGIALDSERGLLIPVVREVDRKSLTDLAVELAELAKRVRAGEVSREDMSGGSFTLSNVGPMGGTHFTPLINHPEVAILGMGRAALRPVVRGSLDRFEIEPRLQLPLSLGYDHRVNDGADAARFLGRIIELLSDVERFALAV